ncbi:MAG: FtsX-like permease family protein [Actinomycetota bacterium]|nr:FtsX-like permease family protein [Actinomycetota bacterium]
MLGLTWIRGLLARRRGRLLAAAGGVAIAVALLGSIGSFLASSKATMTRRAIGDVPVDWQVETQTGANAAAVARTVASQPYIVRSADVGIGQTTGFQATTQGSTQTTGPGVVLGLPDQYRVQFPGELRDLAGRSTGVLLAQQTAANLHAAPGDTVQIGRAGLTPVRVRVAGVVDLPQADSLFQKVGAPVGAQPQAPPDNVLLLTSRQWHSVFDPLATRRPDLVRHQIHVTTSHNVPSDPSSAYTVVTGRARNLEVKLAGSALVGDNLGAKLGAARSDALYAQVLFVFLGLPGAVLAGLLTAAIAGSGAERRRREQSVLRARGASTRQLIRISLLEAITVGLLGAGVGLVVARIVGAVAFTSSGVSATTNAGWVWAAGAAVIGVLIAMGAVSLPAWRDARTTTVASGRRSQARASSPRWMRFGVDLLLLAGSGVVFWITSRNGYKLVLAPEGVPTISVNYWAFAGPALLWAGAGLLAWRVSDLLLTRGRPLLRHAARPLAGPLSGIVSGSMARQRRPLSRALVLVALTIAFASSTAVFNATYRQQAEADAQLSNGADVTVTESPGVRVDPAGATALARIRGVHSVEPIQHRFAYVGADLQDLYGVRPDTIVEATRLQDAYFQGGSAQSLMDRIVRSPDSILVSDETVKDFQLRPGDTVVLRLQDGRTKQLEPVRFRYAGIAKEFPTAPHDSFMVANASYVARMTGNNAVGAFLINTNGSSPPAVASRVRAAVGPGAQITDITSSRKVVGSSLTAVDLAGLTRVELGFALVLAASATGLMLLLGLAERRRTFAIASALGARTRQLGGFVWTEAAFITIGGLTAGALTGWAMANMLVKVLTGVFDPPPAGVAVPYVYLSGLLMATVAAVIVAASAAIRTTRRPAIATLRDLS